MASIYLRRQVWWVTYYQDGKKIFKSLKTRDKTAANYKKNEIENRLAIGDLPLLKKETKSLDVYEEYLGYLKNRVADSTLNCYRYFIHGYINQQYLVSSIDEKSVSSYITRKFKDDNIAPRTANHILKYIKAFLNFAVSRKYIVSNPLAGTKLYRVEKKQPRFLSAEEVTAILESAKGEEIYPMIATAIYTGMRIGEIKRLIPEDINFERNTVTVKVSKSKRFRVIPIHSKLREILLKTGLKSFTISNFRRVFKRVKKRAGLPQIGFHTFRHTFASHLVMSGVDIVTVSKLLGHSDISTTMIYSHLSQGHINKSIEFLTI